MSKAAKMAAAAAAVLMLTACASTKFSSTWKDPDVAPLGKMQGKTIIACVVTGDELVRQGSEEALAYELNKRGADAVPSYKILPPGVKDEALAKAAFEKAGAAAAVVMRPFSAGEEAVVATTVYTGGYYGGFWGGYWGYGWGQPMMAASFQSNTVIVIETLFYSLEQNKLVWAGQSKTTNPKDMVSLMKDLVAYAAAEMKKDKVF